MKTNYVLGFAFSAELDKVLMIRKSKPEWQKGMLNGVGGKIEPNEEPINAIVREFEEETGIHTQKWQWTEFALMDGPFGKCHCFKAFDVPIEEFKITTEEEPKVVYVSNLHYESTISNVKWLTLMARDGEQFFSTIKYS